MPEVVPVSANPAWVIESSRINDSCAWTPFKREPDVRPAPWAELQVKPTTRFIRDMSVLRQQPTCDLDLLFVEYWFHRERSPCSFLTPRAVAYRDSERVAMRHVAYGPTDTSTFVPLRHRRPLRVRSVKSLVISEQQAPNAPANRAPAREARREPKNATFGRSGSACCWASLDDPIGAREHRQRDREAQRFGGAQVDDHL